MAKGGSGDVLTGMAGALLAQGVAAETVGWLASELHGLAGEEAVRTQDERCVTAEDQIRAFSDMFRRLQES